MIYYFISSHGFQLGPARRCRTRVSVKMRTGEGTRVGARVLVQPASVLHSTAETVTVQCYLCGRQETGVGM